MDPHPENPSPPKRDNQIQIQGPRPSPLKINKDSHKIKKPPIVPKPPNNPPPLPATGNQPVIIYSISPKPIVVEPSNFRSIVQHLTGKDSTPPESNFSGETPVSPAARFASIERTSPGERERRERRIDDVIDMMMGEGVGDDDGGVNSFDVGQIPGILSPSPANLPVISSAMFSPATENFLGFGFGGGVSELMMSPFFSNTSFLPSPSALFLSNFPLVSPSPSFADLYNIFD
ncbi:hypothetical protein BVRB_6g133020 [Beta vulgaris subsp. vulgaris]|uniref:protein MKS1 n=1 Tax=Beta vulgaris subsp. vulgaris TaxID=3555 RepID=UPI000540216B|nr:protein MKS1 [Beta vulgaris subsp. vulgaris]KMT09200.1 hypothetical protein BVRB_6g133020 [Beta vulgaris subsp. vulgaris]